MNWAMGFLIGSLVVVCASLGFALWVNGYVTANGECLKAMSGGPVTLRGGPPSTFGTGGEIAVYPKDNFDAKNGDCLIAKTHEEGRTVFGWGKCQEEPTP